MSNSNVLSFSLKDITVNYKEIKLNFDKIKNNNENEINKLIKKFLPIIKKKSCINNKLDEDLMQDIIYLLITKWIYTYDYENGDSFFTYLTNCSENYKNDYLQREQYRKHISINEKVGDENGEKVELQDFFEDDIDIEQVFEKKELHDFINNIIDNLEFKHKFIIKLYYGFQELDEHNLKEIAKLMDYSYQYISQELEKINQYIKNRLQWEGYI